MENQENRPNNSHSDHIDTNEGSAHSSSERNDLPENNVFEGFTSWIFIIYRISSDRESATNEMEEESADHTTGDTERQSESYSSEYIVDYEDSDYSDSEVEDYSGFELAVKLNCLL